MPTEEDIVIDETEDNEDIVIDENDEIDIDDI